MIVVGAGPAGASAARTAAQHGLKTLLLEKHRVPRDKLCGGGITPKVLTRFDFKVPMELMERESKSTRIHVGDKNYRFETDRTIVYMSSRAKFDTFLTEKAVEAGAELRDGNAVQRISVGKSDVQVGTSNGSFSSKLLIGADGMGGPTARACGLYDRWHPFQVAYAIESEVPVGERVVDDFVGSQEYFDLYFGVSPAGYGWIFPKGDHLTVGVGCRLNSLRDARSLFDGFTRRIPELRNAPIPSPQAHLIPMGGVAKIPIVADRVMLAGDSAAFAEPLLGEGIHFAVWGAQIAAQVAAQACREDSFDRDFLTVYERRCKKAFIADFDIAYQVAKFSYLVNYDMDRVARFFFGERKVQECMIGLMDGSVRYRDARAKLAWPYFKYRLAKLGLAFYS